MVSGTKKKAQSAAKAQKHAKNTYVPNPMFSNIGGVAMPLEKVSLVARALEDDIMTYTMKFESQLIDTDSATPLERMLIGKISGGKAQASGE